MVERDGTGAAKARHEPGGTLEYGRVQKCSFAAAAARPISLPFAMLLFLIATWPFLLYVASPTLLYMRPMVHIVYGGTLCFVAGCVFAVRCMIIAPLEAVTPEALSVSRRRLSWLAAGIAGYIALHATGLPLTLLFIVHRPAFERAADAAERTLPPGSRALHGRIGLFHVVQVARGDDGEVGFSVEGDAIYRDPTPATSDCLFYPPGNGGRLIGSWYWEATD